MESQVTISQLYTGFIGLSEHEIFTHPLGPYLKKIGSQSLGGGMISSCYMVSQNQYFLLILENGTVVGQQTVWPEQNSHYELLKKRAIRYDNIGFYMNTQACKNIYIQKKDKCWRADVYRCKYILT